MHYDHYDGAELLSQKDLTGKKPEIFLCTSNRSAGKTTYFSRLLVNRFLKHEDKFALLYRYRYELDNCADKFFKDINGLFFQGHTMMSKKRANGIYHELFFDNKSCGYSIALNSADQIKKNSHFFSDVTRILFDEFQSETNRYCPNEIEKFISVHTSIARGNGKMCRYVPVYMLSNATSLLNPYYLAMGISTRLKNETRFLKGNGWVLEQGFIETAAKAQNESQFNKAFSNEKYIAYSSQGVYLNDNLSFIETPTGKSNYLVTIKFNDKLYSIREFQDKNILYCSSSADKTFPFIIAATTDDHQLNTVILKRNDNFLTTMKYFFNLGCFRFDSIVSKDVLLKLLSI